MTERTSESIDSGSEAAKKLVGADRTLAVLAELALHPAGVQLDELATAVDSPKPTVHRALASLRRAGFAAQDGYGRYVLGHEFLRLAFTHQEARPDHLRMDGALRALSENFGETVHYTVLEGADVVYRAKVDPPIGSVRLTSFIGGRNPAHCTAAGKLLLAFQLSDRAAVKEWIGSRELERRTASSLTTLDELGRELQRIRDLGYAVDDQESEAGINCFAVPVYLGSAQTPTGAVSVSALSYRTPLVKLVDARDDIVRTVGEAVRGELM